jgi:outer membrane protein W
MSLRTVVITVALALLTFPLLAQSNDIGFWINGSHATGSTNPDATTHIELVDKIGWGLSVNHAWCDHVSTELAVALTNNNASLRIDGTPVLDLGQLKQTVVTGVGQWHFARKSAIDPYVGAGAAYVKTKNLNSADLALAGIGTVKIRNKASWVANAGMNVNLTPRLAVVFDAKYIALQPESSGATGSSQKLKLDPLVYSAGIRLRF